MKGQVVYYMCGTVLWTSKSMYFLHFSIVGILLYSYTCHYVTNKRQDKSVLWHESELC